MAIEVDEIISRSSQGVTLPFICRCSDGDLYFVKGRGAGRRSLVCEWVAGHLAHRIGLPVPPFFEAIVPQELTDLKPRDDINDLGPGSVFASKKVQLVELTVAHLDDVSEQQQMDLLAFDYWIRNGDRNLTTRGGNPNVFWNSSAGGLVVLDHNQAFDEAFDPEAFVSMHVFANQASTLRGDFVLQQSYTDRFMLALEELDHICDTCPSEWWYIDEELTLPLDTDREKIRAILGKVSHQDFWKLP